MTTRTGDWPYASRLAACLESILCKKVKMFNLFGIDCFLNSSVAAIPLCLVLSGNLDWGVGIYVLGVAASVFLHELGHAWGGWIVDNPAKEICLVACGGYTRFYNNPGVTARDALMSFAGPMANGLIFCLLAWIESAIAGVTFGEWARMLFAQALGGDTPTGKLPFSFVLMNAIACVNAYMLVFNLLPAFPLDGGRIFGWFAGYILPSRNAAMATKIVSRIVACLMILRSLLVDLVVEFNILNLVFMVFVSGWIWQSSRDETT